ncbi:MAG TPA: peptidoglycan DD-metalloendopeptidase family protein [Candidatus Wallbacteria bacterium]|nr:peptidoglycan DD-metalloendopeptidase family protein [Candidatus Wallbacteria bacterium]
MKKHFSNYLTTTFIISAIMLSFTTNVYASDISDVKNSLQDNSIANTASTAAASTNAASQNQSGVVATDCLNVRSGPWGNIIGTVSSGQTLDIIGKEGVWYKINYNGGVGYVHSGYVTTDGAPATAGDQYVNVGNDTLNVRTGPWGDIIGSLSNGTSVEVLGTSGEWSIIKYNNQEAYVYTQYLSKDKPAEAAVASTSTPSSSGLIRPVDGGDITSPFGMRTHPVTGVAESMHYGVDLGVGTGTDLKALAGGTVESVDWCYGGGNTIKIKYSNGMSSVYMHCLDSTISAGDTVAQGQVVGHTNNTGAWTTGPHLHFELHDASGEAVNPQDYISI